MSARLDETARLEGCWLGKNIGGAIGMPFEGCPGPRPRATLPVSLASVPNDDLEMQMIGLVAMERDRGAPSADTMASLWMETLDFAPDEYGLALRNLKRGILPPESGCRDNWFRHGMGAVIRTEVWASVAPGDPAVSATLAANDASIDHSGEGIEAAVFMAALQSLLFAGADLQSAVREARCFLKPTGRSDQAVDLACSLAHLDPERASAAWKPVFGSPNFTDSLMNLGHILMSLLSHDRDPARCFELALQFGEDADCTCASVGATLGILHGPEIFSRWGSASGTFEFSPAFERLDPPRTVRDLTRRILALRGSFRERPPEPWPAPAPVAPPVSRWLVVPGSEATPDSVNSLGKGEHPPTDLTRTASGVFWQISGALSKGASALHLATRLHVSSDFSGWMMLAADTGLTAWLNGEMVANYHGRHPMVPAFHRTEGGCCFRIDLRRHSPPLLHIRLMHPPDPCGFCADLATNTFQAYPGYRFDFV